MKWTSRRLSVTRPDQDPPFFIDGQALAVNELVLQDLQVGVIELELELEGPVRQAASLAQQGDHLIHDRDKEQIPGNLSRKGGAPIIGKPRGVT
jgi:hypothetical protein